MEKDKHLQNFKSLIDFAIAKGIFNNAEAVVGMMDSYLFIKQALDNSERTMPEKSNTK
jgi:hypothetical protein